MNRLEKLKLDKWIEYAITIDKKYNPIQQANMPTVLSENAFHIGFEAASAEYEKIIAELEGALEYINDWNNWHDDFIKSEQEKGNYPKPCKKVKINYYAKNIKDDTNETKGS